MLPVATGVDAASQGQLEPARTHGDHDECTPGDNLIFRHTEPMRTMTATEASRRFSDLLDAIERGETVTITRGQVPVAEVRPARRRTGTDLDKALRGIEPPDDRFADSIARALALVASDRSDPWEDA